MLEIVTIPLAEISRRVRMLTLPDVDIVVGIATGGTVASSIIAHQFEKPLVLLHINYRAADNSPRYEAPMLLRDAPRFSGRRVLLVDDVSVTGATLDRAMDCLHDYQVTTLVLKGQGDIVLFPEITTCVNWPWSEIRRGEGVN